VVEVSRLAGAMFLLLFDTSDRQNGAHHRGGFCVGHVQFRLLPLWRQVSATALSRFQYKVRVCIEGFPEHVRRAGSVASLFPRPSFVDVEFCDMEKLEEEECLCLWVWTTDSEGIPITATVQVEEPVTMPQDGYVESLIEMDMPVGAIRIDQAEALDYHLIVHVDRVLDYSPLPASPSHQNFTSGTSGIPDDELEPEWPKRYPFMWRHG
jgi:hypothetical protein